MVCVRQTARVFLQLFCTSWPGIPTSNALTHCMIVWYTAGVRLISSERIAVVEREWATEGGVDSLFANGNKTHWGLGYHLYHFTSAGGETPRPNDAGSEGSADSDFNADDAEVDANSDKSIGDDEIEEGTEAFGHSGIGGSVAFCDPRRKLAVAITVNHLVSNRVVARRVISCITEVLGFGGTYDDFH